MKKYIFLVICLFLIACTESKRHAKTEIINVDSLSKIAIKSDTISFLNKHLTEFVDEKRLEIEINYPQLVYYHIDESRQILNSLIKFDVDNFKSSFILELAPREALDSIGEPSNNKFDMRYEIINNSNELASLIFDVELYYAGAAHSISFIKSINFDLQRSRLITEDDLYQDTLLLNKISEISRRELLKNIDVDSIWVKDGTTPLIDNFRNFNLATDSLYITFDIYQVGPYSDGSKRIGISYNELDTLLPKRIIDMNFK